MAEISLGKLSRLHMALRWRITSGKFTPLCQGVGAVDNRFYSAITQTAKCLDVSSADMKITVWNYKCAIVRNIKLGKAFKRTF